MGRYVIEGGYPVCGEVTIGGSKNAVLPILAASVLNGGKTILHHCPQISDFFFTLDLLVSLGCVVEREGRTVYIDSSIISENKLETDVVKKMRSSIIFMGALLGRFDEVRIGYPGGCEIGIRPIDFHLKAFEKMGIDIQEEKGVLHCVAVKRKGRKINLDFPSVGATENIMLLATKSAGRTVIYNAAREPEIVELQKFLNQCGGKIRGAGTDTIYIDGVKELKGTEFTIFPDRIEAGTYLCAAAMTGGEIILQNVMPETMRQILLRFGEMGCEIQEKKDRIFLKAPMICRSIERIHTCPYPGFPTDMQPQFMSVLTLANGTSMISETVFESRLKHITDLCRMGADITVEGQTAVIKGVQRLKGTCVTARDLRGGAALILAGLAAEGETIVENSFYMERGYENIEEGLAHMGAKIRLEKE